VPDVRPFRALRYESDVVGDLAAVVSPPYDLIDPTEAADLLNRHPKNAVRLDLPLGEQGDGPDDRYRRAARTFAAWRSDGTFRKDPRPSLYVYEQERNGSNGPAGQGPRSVRRGFFGRLRLEPFGPGGGVEPREAPGSAQREDRYKLLRATGVNTSPIVVRLADPAGDAGQILAAVTNGSPDVDFSDTSGVHHRVWAVAADGPDAEKVASLLAAAGAGPVTIADGQARYESALRYRDERRMSRSCEEDPAFDYILALFVDGSDADTQPPTGLVLNPHEW
jgi:uncharacterized protein (DUF1015 family)